MPGIDLRTIVQPIMMGDLLLLYGVMEKRMVGLLWSRDLPIFLEGMFITLYVLCVIRVTVCVIACCYQYFAFYFAYERCISRS